MGPLICAGQRERVRSYVEESTAPVDVAFRGDCPGRRRVLVPADGRAAPRHGRRGLARGGLRPGRRGDAVRRRGRRGRHGQRHRVRPVRLDLDPRPRPRAAGRARRRGRQPLGQLALQRCATGRRSAASSSPGSAASSARTPRRVHRGEERLHRPRTEPRQGSLRSKARRQDMAGRLEGKVAVVTGGCSGIGLATVRRFARRARRSSSATSTRPTGRGRRPAEVGGVFVACRRHRQGAGRRAVPHGEGRLRLGRHRVQQRRHLAAGGRLDPRHRPRGLAPGAGGQPDQRLPVLQGGAARTCSSRARARSSTRRRSWR